MPRPLRSTPGTRGGSLSLPSAARAPAPMSLEGPVVLAQCMLSATGGRSTADTRLLLVFQAGYHEFAQMLKGKEYANNTENGRAARAALTTGTVIGNQQRAYAAACPAVTWPNLCVHPHSKSGILHLSLCEETILLAGVLQQTCMPGLSLPVVLL